MKIGVPTRNNLVDPHFGNCEKFMIFTIENKTIVNTEELTPPAGCGCKTNVIPELSAKGVTVMLAGNMGGGAVNMLANHGITVIRGCEGNAADVVNAYLKGDISDSGVGCAGHGPDCG